MSKIVEKLAANGHLTDEQVEKIGHRVQMFMKELRENPELMEKTAAMFRGPGEALGYGAKIMGLGALLGVGSLGATAGVQAVAQKVKDYQSSIDKAKNYKAMLDANPELATKNVDAKMVQRHFDTLHRFNPEYAADPVVAGTYVQNSLEFARPNIEALNNIVNARKNLAQAKAQSMIPGALGAGVSTAVGTLTGVGGDLGPVSA